MNCSTCGYGVEWLRSCYASEWRFNPADPTMTTSGRFVFCPDGTPCYPGLTLLGSRIWTSSEREPEPLLGEVTAAKQSYYRGNGPDPFPDPIRIGSEECLRDGEHMEGFGPWRFELQDQGSWSMDGEAPRMSFVAGVGCGGTEDPIQLGNARRMITLSEPRNVTVTITARFPTIAEAPTAGVGIDGEAFNVVVHSPGGGFPCEMGDVSATATIPFPAGTHDLNCFADTVQWPGDGTGYARFSFEWEGGEPGNPNEFIDGFDARCYLPPVMPELPPQPRPSPFDPREWLRFSEFLVMTYDDMSVAAAAVQAYFGGTATIETVDNTSSVIPGSLIAWNADFAVVLIPGTTNFQQLCLQVLDPGVGLVNWGAYSAPTIWQAAYAAIQARIAATGVDPTGPIFLAGHSYGGAVATLLAANYQLFNSARDIRLFTIGAPRAGDARLAQILAPIKRVHLANANDGVTGIPPVAGELPGLAWVLPPLLYAQWTASSKMGHQVALSAAGEATSTDDSQLSYIALVDLIIEIVNSLAIPPYVAHFSAEYVRRIKLYLGK